MKFVTFSSEGLTQPGVCIDGDVVISLTEFLSGEGLGDGATLIDLIAAGPALLAKIAAAGAELPGARFALGDVHLLAPIPRPAKNVFCVGRNYKAHVAEASAARGKQANLPEHPQYFSKPPTAVIGPYDDVPLHDGLTEALDYEAELGVVIGKKGVNIPREAVFDHIFGYTVINDVTARDLQKRHDRWFKGKGLDGSCPMGPWIVTADEIADPTTLEVSLTVNGDLRQKALVNEMIFDIPEIVSVLSQGLTLEPGDVIATGTPSGVGFAMKPPCLLADGDVMEVTVAGVGTLRNTVRK